MSKIPLHYSLKVAHKVVRELEKVIPAQMTKHLSIQSWGNGREQGLSIQYAMGRIEEWLSINVAQQRSSDSILIVHGSNFDHQTNQPGDQEWEANRVCFDYCDYEGAVNHIMGLLSVRWTGDRVMMVKIKKRPAKKDKKAKVEIKSDNKDNESKDKFDKSELAELMG